MPPVRIAVVTDDRSFGQYLIDVVTVESSFAVSLTDAVRHLLPPVAIVLIDARIDASLDACSAATQTLGAMAIVVAAPDDPSWAVSALEAGARGVVSRAAPEGDILQATRVALSGEIWAPRQALVSAWIKHMAAAKARGREADAILLEQRLSAREREVFRHAARGLANKELADRLAISEATVKVHLAHIFQKLRLRGRAELAAAYFGIRRTSLDR